jgi:hypothetical protein
MSRTALLAAAVLTLAGAARADGPPDVPPFNPAKPPPEAERAQRLALLQVRMTPDQVRRLLGEPQHTARQVLNQRCLEQWVYDQVFQVRLEFEYPRGQEPHLLSVPPTNPGKP